MKIYCKILGHHWHGIAGNLCMKNFWRIDSSLAPKMDIRCIRCDKRFGQ